MLPVTVVSATRHSQAEFFETTLLGRSLRTYDVWGIKCRILYKNQFGLSACYNQAIDREVNEDEILVFVHDDILIVDFFWIHKLVAGLEKYEVVGVVGNRRRVARQPSWLFVDEKLTKDDLANVAGVWGDGDGFPCKVDVLGGFMEPMKLLDGMFLAAKKKTFTNSGVRFDERFKFHFYDMDVCRQFEARGVSMSTIPLCVIHASPGDFRSEGWREGYRAYLNKWRE